MRLLAIDPGTHESAWVLFDLDAGVPVECGIWPNYELALSLPERRGQAQQLAIEMVASYGMAVGSEVFETCLWIGRFIQAWGGPHTKVYRKDVKLALCGSVRAKDANIRQALLDRWGGREQAIGCKAAPGPLHGFRADLWAALAVAVAWAESSGGARA